MKYFQEFKVTQALAELIKQFKLQETIARNMVSGEYALNPRGLEIVNQLENSFVNKKEALKEQAEDAVEELASNAFNLVVVEGLVISLNPFQSQISLNQTSQVLSRTVMTEEQLIAEALQMAPELFWVIHPESPLYSPPYRSLVAEVQYYNFLINLV